MISRDRIQKTIIRTTVFILLFLTVGFYSRSVRARVSSAFEYVGFEGTFGVRSFRITSDVAQLDQMAVRQGGGSLGVIFGNDFLRAKARATGFYSSVASVVRTIDLFESEIILNFYPLQSIRHQKSAMDVYVLARHEHGQY